MKFCVLALTVVLLLCGGAAQAQRLGGGKSLGKQSTHVMQKQAAPAAPGSAGTANASAKPGESAIAPPAAQPKRAWGGLLGGMAAGLGLAWLAQSLGFGDAAANVMTVALILVLVLSLVTWLARRRLGAQPAAPAPFAFQGLPAGARAAPLHTYSPQNVGNDASARPFERKGLSFDSMTNPGAPMVKMGPAQSGLQGWSIPPGFDTEGFLQAAKANFVHLQAAWDRSDLAGLRAMMTDGMLAEIQTQLNEREQHTGGPANFTDVVMIQARLLGIEDLGADYMASVEFSGMIREDLSAGPSPFREVWNMTKPKSDSSGWLVAGVQALQ
jgi:predicted lipid-binding transport protein (Tim44 family)